MSTISPAQYNMITKRWARVVMVAILFSCQTGRQALATTYTSHFPLTENPISEGGKWINGQVAGVDWSNCATSGGMIHGVQNNGGGPNYNDSTALLTGSWGSDQTVTVTLYKGPVDESLWPEAEIHLRCSLSAHSATGYEVLYSMKTDSSTYIGIVRWNGAYGDFTALGPAVSGIQYVATNGSTLKATIVGSTITAYLNGVPVITNTDTTAFATGNPGAGFDHNGGSANDSTFGFTTFTATDGPASPSISTQPQGQAVNLTSNASFETVATGASPLFYQWYFNGTRPIAGATTSQVILTNVQAGQAGGYSVVVTNAIGAVTSAVAPLTVTSSGSIAYVMSRTLGTLRNNFSGYAGMQIVVGPSPITVTELGRMMANGNNGTHTLKVVKAGDGTDVAGGSVSIAMGAGTAGQFQYATLSTPVVLAAGTAYYVLSQETAGEDAWYNYVDTTVTTTSVATETSAAWGYGIGQWYLAGDAGHGQSFVPLDFKYNSSAAPIANAQQVTTQENASTNLALTGSDPNGLPLTYIVVSGPSHGTLGGGAPNVRYTPASNYSGPDSFTFKVNNGNQDSGIATVAIIVTGSAAVDPVLTWTNPADVVYGSPLSAQQLNATANVPGTFAYTPGTGALLAAGNNQVLSVTFTPTDQLKYNSISRTVSLSVLKAQLTITANNQTKAFGAALPVLTASYAGLVNGDTPASLTTPVSLTTTATSTSPVGTYPIVANGGTSANYTITYLNGTLTVTSSSSVKYVTSQILGKLRNNYSGYVGMQITVATNPITVTALGRMMASGNNGTHTLKLVKASDGTDVAGGSVSIAMGAGAAGQFQYASLSTPVVLAPGTAYYVMSHETAGGDAWYNYLDTTVTTTSVATETSAAWGYGIGQWYLAGDAGRSQSFVPLDFKYNTSAPPAQGAFATSQMLGTFPEPTRILKSGIVIDDARRTGPAEFQISFFGQPGQSYEIQSSTNGSVWLQIGTVIAANQKVNFVDTTIEASSFRLYRIVQGPLESAGKGSLK